MFAASRFCKTLCQICTTCCRFVLLCSQTILASSKMILRGDLRVNVPKYVKIYVLQFNLRLMIESWLGDPFTSYTYISRIGPRVSTNQRLDLCWPLHHCSSRKPLDKQYRQLCLPRFWVGCSGHLYISTHTYQKRISVSSAVWWTFCRSKGLNNVLVLSCCNGNCIALVFHPQVTAAAYLKTENANVAARARFQKQSHAYFLVNLSTLHS